ASSPRTVFSFVKQPSWQTARAWGESAKQASTSAVRNKPYRKGDRPIDFPKCRVVIFFVEVGFLNCINCNPVPRGTRNHPHKALSRGLTSADSGLQLDLEIALSGGFQRSISPTNFQFGQRCVETSADVIVADREASADTCRAYFFNNSSATGKIIFSHSAYSFAEGCRPSAATNKRSLPIFLLSSKTSTRRRPR